MSEDLCIMCHPICEVCGTRFTPYKCKAIPDMVHCKFCKKCNQDVCEL